MTFPRRRRRRQKKRWRRKWKPIDPIQRLIDWQSRSLAYLWGHDLPGKNCGPQDVTEERFCDALDEKYAPITDDLLRRVFYLAKEGHTHHEIAEFIGHSTHWVRKALTRTREQLARWTLKKTYHFPPQSVRIK